MLHSVDTFHGISKHFPSIESLVLVDSRIQNCHGGIENLQQLTTLELKVVLSVFDIPALRSICQILFRFTFLFMGIRERQHSNLKIFVHQNTDKT